MSHRDAMRIALSGVLLSTLLAGCDDAPRRLRPGGAGFSVELPGEYTCSQRRRDADGTSSTIYTCGTEYIGGGLFGRIAPARISVTWEKVPPGVTADQLRPELSKAYAGAPSPGKLTTERPGALDGVAGLEIETVDRSNASAAAITVRARHVINSGTLVGVIIDGQVDADAEQAWRAVLNSFRFE